MNLTKRIESNVEPPVWVDRLRRNLTKRIESTSILRNPRTQMVFWISQRELKEHSAGCDVANFSFIGISQRELKGFIMKLLDGSASQRESHKENWKYKSHAPESSKTKMNLTKRIESLTSASPSGVVPQPRISQRELKEARVGRSNNILIWISQRELKVRTRYFPSSAITIRLNLTKRIESTIRLSARQATHK